MINWISGMVLFSAHCNRCFQWVVTVSQGNDAGGGVGERGSLPSLSLALGGRRGGECGGSREMAKRAGSWGGYFSLYSALTAWSGCLVTLPRSNFTSVC